LTTAMESFTPSAVVHLAARTDLAEDAGLQGYAANIEGVRNLLQVVAGVPSIKRVLFASSKLVNKNGQRAGSVSEYAPNTVYGMSKALGEQLVREAPPSCEWAILRPTSIWGPWLDAPYYSFFRSVSRGIYFHMLGCDLPKRFGYVGNTTAQILALLECPGSQMHGDTFYLADYSVTSIREWADEISMQLRGKRNLQAPNWLTVMAAHAGDFAKKCGFKDPPLTSFRLRNLLTQTDDVPLENTTNACEDLPYSQAEGVRQTLEWLRDGRAQKS
ncbi:MAG: NAD(P)-dependent oxidoreductase, partial [Acidobacteriaceae bacterium]